MERATTRRWIGAAAVVAVGLLVAVGPAKAAPPDPTYEVSTEFDQYQLNDMVDYEGTCYPAGSGAGQSENVVIRVYAVATSDYPGDLTGGTTVQADGSFTGSIQLAANLPDGLYRIEATCREQQGAVVQTVYSADFGIGVAPPTTTTSPTASTTTNSVVETTTLESLVSVPTTTAPPAAAPATATTGSPSYTG